MASKVDNDIQDRNIAAAFSVIDSNGDGQITEEDFDLLGNQVCQRLGIPGDSDAGRKLRGSYLAWWSQLSRDLDTDGDGAISKAEFAAAYNGGKGDAERFFAEQLGRTAKVVADLIDTDGDGFISDDEYLKLLEVARVDREAALAGFHQLDADGDGRISVAEFQVGVQQLMLSNDPNAAGTSMLGQH